MSINEETGLDIIPDLPLLHILGYLPTKDQIEVGLVSKRWMQLLNARSFGDKRVLVVDENSNFLKHSQRTHRRVKLSTAASESDIHDVLLKIGKFVTHLEIQTNSERTLTQFPVVRKIRCTSLDWMSTKTVLPDCLTEIHVTEPVLPWINKDVLEKVKQRGSSLKILVDKIWALPARISISLGRPLNWVLLLPMSADFHTLWSFVGQQGIIEIETTNVLDKSHLTLARVRALIFPSGSIFNRIPGRGCFVSHKELPVGIALCNYCLTLLIKKIIH